MPRNVIITAQINNLIQGNTFNTVNIDAVFIEINKTIDDDNSLTDAQKDDLKRRFEALKPILKEIKKFGSPFAGQLLAQMLVKLS